MAGALSCHRRHPAPGSGQPCSVSQAMMTSYHGSNWKVLFRYKFAYVKRSEWIYRATL